MPNNYKNLFIQQSYETALREYAHLISDPAHATMWDYVALTASSEEQAQAYRKQIEYRRSIGLLPRRTEYIVLADPDGKRVGSGGATLNVLRSIALIEKEKRCGDFDFSDLKILCVHSGGDSKRVPQYSAVGKLFSPVPRRLRNGASSTLFDELMMMTCAVPQRMSGGMLVCSGDVLLLFDPLGLEYFSRGAVAISVKTTAAIGCAHGVYVEGNDGAVARFLHKQPISVLEASGAVDVDGNVNIDTGAVLLDGQILNKLYSLVDTDERFKGMVNERVRLSFYADFSYPLSSEATLDGYLAETPEGELTAELIEARHLIWEKLSGINMRLNVFSPASFLHFGTTAELHRLMTVEIGDYSYLDWVPLINTNISGKTASQRKITVNNGYIHKDSEVCFNCYIEDSYIDAGATVGDDCVISCARIPSGAIIPMGTVVSGIRLKNGKYVARIYGVGDNPKECYHFDRELSSDLWSAPLFPVCDTPEQAVLSSLAVCFGNGVSNADLCELISLERSFREAGDRTYHAWREDITVWVRKQQFIDAVERGESAEDVNSLLSDIAPELAERVYEELCEYAEDFKKADLTAWGTAMRIYGYLHHVGRAKCEDKCFKCISDIMLSDNIPSVLGYEPKKDEASVSYPVRVNFGGGWTDTPPYCLENGGAVLNAAIILNGEAPVLASVRRLPQRRIVLISEDGGERSEYGEGSISELLGIKIPIDPFAIHKAALSACGLIGEGRENEIFDLLGGGLELRTEVKGIPNGSGLGTSSILAGACLKAVYELFGVAISEESLWAGVMLAEQLMTSGGGWQDQIGGMTSGIKLIESKEGMHQRPVCTLLPVPDKALAELEERFAVIYTGQRRMARNIVREMMGKYIVSDRNTVDALARLRRLPKKMSERLLCGDVDGFAELLTENWNITMGMDVGCSNECIDEIFRSVEHLICGKMICGAGGGGYLQVILKRGVTVSQLEERLFEVFGNCDIKAQGCRFV